MGTVVALVKVPPQTPYFLVKLDPSKRRVSPPAGGGSWKSQMFGMRTSGGGSSGCSFDEDRGSDGGGAGAGATLLPVAVAVADGEQAASAPCSAPLTVRETLPAEPIETGCVGGR